MNPQKLVDNFSTHLKNTIARAISLAAYLGAPQVEPPHLLAALTKEEGAIGSEVLKRVGMTYESIIKLLVRKYDVESINELPSVDSNLPELSAATRSVLEKAMLLAYNRSHNYIGTEHLLYGLIASKEPITLEIFDQHKVSYDEIGQFLETAFQNTGKFTDLDEMTGVFDHLEQEEINNQAAQTPFIGNMMKPKQKHMSAIEQFTVTLTSREAGATLDPVIGRDREIDRIINILARRNKNNPILVGEPGVGKTAIVEGLAKRISHGEVPDILKRKQIISLDLTLLIAGTIYRGEFEARLKQIIDEVTEHPNYILFIDELHNIIGAGSNQGTLDAANILKPALARGQLHCIGATTYDEYKKYIAADPALERRFETIHVDEPSIEETIDILKGLKQYYEEFHRVKISDPAIEKAVELSSKYIHDKFQPDKSIDLIDEASAQVRAGKKSSALEKKYYDLLDQFDLLEEKKETAIQKEKLKEAVQLKKKLEKLEEKIVALSKQLDTKRQGPSLAVDETGIAQTVSNKLGIDFQVVLKNEWEELETLAPRLKTRLIGQEKAIEQLVSTLQQSYVGMTRKDKPFASFLFVGPSGVGKTELAKVLAEELFHDKKALIKLDMSEYSEAHSVSKILGAPAGYVGFKERNQLLDEIRKRPYSVVVLDEIDKAHPDVRKLLLQMLDEGHITDSSGKKTSLKHAIIILTSNVAAELFKTAGIGFGSAKSTGAELEKTIHGRLKEELGSALLSRLDRSILFYPLATDDLATIIKNHLELINAELAGKRAISIKADNTAIDSIIKENYSPDLGARNIPATVERILNELIVEIIKEHKTDKHQFTLTHKASGYSLK